MTAQDPSVEHEPKVIVTARYLFDHDLWAGFCELTGMSEWAVNEGQLDAGEPLALTLAQARTLGVVA